MTLLAFISLFLTFVLGETLVPPYVQRLFIGKDAKHVARGTMLSGIFSIPFFTIAGCIGLVALTIAPDLDPNKSLPYVVNTVLPIGLKGLVIAGIISIVMSSADSFLNSAAIAFTHDVVKPLREENLSEKHELLLSKIVTLFVGVKNAKLYGAMIQGMVMQPASLKASGRLPGRMKEKVNDVVDACIRVLKAD